ncbi:beta strand repeat-containing protein, partial [Marinibactrum halimedae]|nr:filamentous hemagglutinin N-terminal domain-containing protein [Marinibactrum halimedae]
MSRKVICGEGTYLFSGGLVTLSYRGIKRKLHFANKLAASIFMANLCSQVAVAGPAGGTVTAGDGTIIQQDTLTTIDQNTQSMVIDWQSFDVDADETVLFVQPTDTAIAVNNVLNNQVSTISGAIEANGYVVLVNSSGVVFSDTARVDVNGLVVSGLAVDLEDFNAGNYTFRADPNGAGYVINRGIINAANGVALIGNTVENAGQLISAGLVNLSAAREAILTFDEGGLIGIKVSEEVLENTLGTPDAVLNSGTIEASNVVMEGRVSANLFSQAVNNTGIVRATGIDTSGGAITLGGFGGDVITTGTLDASSEGVLAGGDITIEGDTAIVDGDVLVDSVAGQGGTVNVLGDNVGVFNQGNIDASGDTGGGEVLIGGDYLGQNPNVRNAQVTYVGDTAQISSDGGTHGDGGKVIVWADDTTRFYGDISAQGGSESGDGGFIETSGKQYVDLQGAVDASAVNGAAGEWLIDPTDITISNSSTSNITETSGAFNPNAGTSTANIRGADIETALEAGTNVTITTENATGSGEGNIDVNTSITLDLSSDASLTLLADETITVSNNISVTNGDGALDLSLQADNSVSITGATINTNGGNVDIDAGLDLEAGDLGQVSIDSSSSIITTRLTGATAADTIADFTSGSVSIDAVGDITVNGIIDTSGVDGIAGNNGGLGSGGIGGSGAGAGSVTLDSVSGTLAISSSSTINTSGGSGGAGGNGGLANGGNGGDGGDAGDVSLSAISISVNGALVLNEGGGGLGGSSVTATNGTNGSAGTAATLSFGSALSSTGNLTFSSSTLNLGTGSLEAYVDEFTSHSEIRTEGGNITISSAGAVQIGADLATSGSASNIDGGDITITSTNANIDIGFDGTSTVVVVVEAEGNDENGNGYGGDPLDGSGGAITFNALTGLRIRSGSSIQASGQGAGGTLGITLGSGSTSGVTGTIAGDILADIATLTSSDGDDSISISSTSMINTLTVDVGLGDDTIDIDNASATITDIDTVTIGNITVDNAENYAQVGALTSSSLSENFTLTAANSLQESVSGRSFTDVTSLISGGGTETFSAGDLGVILDGDGTVTAGSIALSSDYQTISGVGVLTGTSGNESFTVTGSNSLNETSLASTLSFSGVTGLNGGGGADTLNAGNLGATVGTDASASVSDIEVSPSSGITSITNIGTLTTSSLNDVVTLVDAGGSVFTSATVTVEGTGAGFTFENLSSIDTAAGADEVSLAGDNATITNTGSAIDAGFVNGSSVRFSNVESVTNLGTLTGSALDDSFSIVGASVDSSIYVSSNGVSFYGVSSVDGGAENTITPGDNLTNFTGQSTVVDGAGFRIDGILFEGIEQVDSNNSAVIGTSANETFAITDIGSDGQLDVDFYITSNGSPGAIFNNVSYIDGGGGTDIATLGSGIDTSVQLNTGNRFTITGTAGGSAQIVNVDTVTGANSLIGTSSDDAFRVTSTDGEIVYSGITFQGVTSLSGGGGADTLDNALGLDIALSNAGFSSNSMTFSGISSTSNAGAVNSTGTTQNLTLNISGDLTAASIGSFAGVTGVTGDAANTIDISNSNVTLTATGFTLDTTTIDVDGITTVTNTGDITGTTSLDTFTVTG